MSDTRVKIAIRFESAPGEYEVETLWAIPRTDGYQLDNIPFYVKSLAYRDIVSARPASDGLLEYEGLLRPSGHSTIRILVTDRSEVQRVRDDFRRLGCTSELSDLPQLVAVDVPPDIPYARIKTVLDEGERRNVFEYQEGCLGQP